MGDNETTRKYEFTGGTLEVVHPVSGRPMTLRRIRPLRPLRGVYSSVGGFIETERNLRHEGNAWVGEGAQVYDNAVVSVDAYVRGADTVVRDRAIVTGSACVDGGTISEHAHVGGDAGVYDGATVAGYAMIGGSARVSGEGTLVTGNVEIGGLTRVSGGAYVSGSYTLHISSIGTGGYVTRAGEAVTIEGVTTNTVTVHRTRNGAGLLVAGCQELDPSLDLDTLREIARLHGWRVGDNWGRVLELVQEIVAAWKPVKEPVS